MLYLSENLRVLRKAKDITQEQAAEVLGVSPQSISKWERGDALPDVTMLVSLANFYATSLDMLVGMDKITHVQTKSNVFDAGYKHMREGDFDSAIKIFSDALGVFPNDEDYASYLAMSLALKGGSSNLSQAIELCRGVLAEGKGVKTCHTTRAALCFIYMKAGEKQEAITAARSLPHIRESREMITAHLEKGPTPEDIDSYLKFIAVGESDEQDVIEIVFGVNMVAVCTECGLLDKIKRLREETGAFASVTGRLPQIRLRDMVGLRPNQIRVRRYADYLLDHDFDTPTQATAQIMEVLQKIAQS